MKSYSMKQWRSFFRESLTRDAIKGQFKPGSHLVRIFMFAAVSSITLGVIYNFVGQYLGQTRASTDSINLTTSASKEAVALNEEFTIDLLLTAPNGKKVSQADIRMTLTSQNNGDVTYTAGGYEALKFQPPPGSTNTNYFDSPDSPLVEKLEGAAPSKKFRLVLSSGKPTTELSDKVILKIKFKGAQNGKVIFTVDNSASEIVGPSGSTGSEPVSYTISTASSTQATVTIGAGPTATPAPTVTTGPTVTPGGPTVTTAPTATVAPSSAPSPTRTTDVKPTPTITLAPAPTCTNPGACGLEKEPKPVSMVIREVTDLI